MTDLVKQLEDKKKGCGNTFNRFNKRMELFSYTCRKNNYLCSQCQAEITILEQAIGEIDYLKSRIEFKDETIAIWGNLIEDLKRSNEQAIAEIEKQRQEILDILKKVIDNEIILRQSLKPQRNKHIDKMGNNIFEKFKQQLNQPKTTQDEK